MPREQKSYELRPSPRPLTTGRYTLLSSTVAVIQEDRKYYCYVAFSDALVQKVGKTLLNGVSADDPAYLFVYMEPKQFHVWVCYARDDKGSHLWSGDMHSRPDWLRKLIEVKP